MIQAHDLTKLRAISPIPSPSVTSVTSVRCSPRFVHFSRPFPSGVNPAIFLLRDRHRPPELSSGRGKPGQLPPLGDPDTRKKDDDEPYELHRGDQPAVHQEVKKHRGCRINEA